LDELTLKQASQKISFLFTATLAVELAGLSCAIPERHQQGCVVFQGTWKSSSLLTDGALAKWEASLKVPRVGIKRIPDDENHWILQQRTQKEQRKLDVPTLVAWDNGDIFFDVKWLHWLEQATPGTSSPWINTC
jgi:hypothetical protein